MRRDVHLAPGYPPRRCLWVFRKMEFSSDSAVRRLIAMMDPREDSARTADIRGWIEKSEEFAITSRSGIECLALVCIFYEPLIYQTD